MNTSQTLKLIPLFAATVLLSGCAYMEYVPVEEPQAVQTDQQFTVQVEGQEPQPEIVLPDTQTVEKVDPSISDNAVVVEPPVVDNVPVVAEAPQPVEEEQPPQPPQYIVKPFAGNYPVSQWYSGKHQAVDWWTSYYVPVYAADAGYLTSAENALHGKHIWISHAWGKTLYAHLDWIEVGDGYVEAGQAIGQTGDTGDSFAAGVRAPHLHFAMQVHGTAIDPIKYIQQPQRFWSESDLVRYNTTGTAGWVDPLNAGDGE